MRDFLTALGLVLVIEGVLYALMPDSMKRLMAQAQAIPASILRAGGLLAMATGVAIVWILRR